jgi:hypothetical protein
MGSEDIRRGTRVRVRGCRRRPTLEGLEGTITRRFGGERYVAFEVSLDGGGTELFRPYELEEASEQSVSEKSLPPVVSEKIPPLGSSVNRATVGTLSRFGLGRITHVPNAYRG